MSVKQYVGAGVASIALLLAGTAISATKAVTEEFSPLATPEGITVQPLGLAQGYSLSKDTATKLPRDKIVYTNPDGLTLYTYEKDPAGQSTCVDECAQSWIPALAPGD